MESKEKESGLIKTTDINSLPDLSKAKAMPVDLMSDYWTPKKEGEKKRVFFKEVKDRDVIDKQSGEVYQLPCAFFYERQEDGTNKVICNGSKRLVGVFEDGKIQELTPIEITYKGKQHNTTNSFTSDSWSVKPLTI